ncbi:MAG TPA: type VI secretion system baseplate subunit TssK [Geminicoccaceae bacterium]|nr:type VI secretion system baseplate subunit TssK [Geminicoccaceae bacterium]
MTTDNRVVWSEGMFLRTQHFQQQDRWIEGRIRTALDGLVGHPWGFRRLKLNTGMLATGKIGLAEADGVFPDGTPFAVPDQIEHPLPLPLGEGAPEGIVHLALPEQQPGAIEIDPEGAPDSGARFRGHAVEVRDTVAGMGERALIEVAKPKLQLLHEKDERGGHVCLPVARFQGVQADGAVVIDPDFIPPALTIAAHPAFESWLAELEGKLQSIAEARVAYVTNPAARGAAEVQDLLVLQIVNRVQPWLRHVGAQRTLHPEALFGELLALAGEAATYATGERRPPELPVYRHQDPALCWRPLIDILRRLLVELARPERKAVPVPLRLHARSGVRTTEAPDPRLFAEATFVLAVKAAMPAEKVRQLFPRQSTIGPAEEFHDLWHARLRGVEVAPLPVAPRQIPWHSGMVYFELDRASPYWKKLPASAGLALGVTGDWPELEMECWAIRD